MLNLDLMVASSAIVVAAVRMPVEMTERLLAEFVSVVTASELTEKGTDEGTEAFAAGQEPESAVDLSQQTQTGIVG